jgi:hypothetical protein
MRVIAQIPSTGRTGVSPVPSGASPDELHRELVAFGYPDGFVQRARRLLGQAGRLSYP